MANSANHPPSSSPIAQATRNADGLAVRRRNPHTFLTSVAVIAQSRQELEALTGYKVDSVSGFEKTDGGWRLSITVVELRRIPAATDVLACYEVSLNEVGDVISYHRSKRFFRDQVGEEE